MGVRISHRLSVIADGFGMREITKWRDMIRHSGMIRVFVLGRSELDVGRQKPCDVETQGSQATFSIESRGVQKIKQVESEIPYLAISRS